MPRVTLEGQIKVLTGLQGELEVGIGEVENLEFHHAEPASIEGAHYARLILMLEAVNAQIKKLPVTQVPSWVNRVQ